jgi:hypothetical protein
MGKILLYLTLALVIVLVCAFWWNWPTLLEERAPHLPVIVSGTTPAVATLNTSALNTSALKGQYGDSFGPLNTLFTGFALVGLIYTLLAQMREANEARFFRFLDLWYSYVSGLEYIEDKDTTLKGKAVLTVIWNKTAYLSSKNPRPATPVDEFVARYDEVFENFETVLSPYWRSLYRTFRYIDKSVTLDKTQAYKTVRAILSGTELSLLAANCLTEQGAEFKPLVEKFHLLKHLPGDRLHGITLEQLKASNAFKPSAFKD